MRLFSYFVLVLCLCSCAKVEVIDKNPGGSSVQPTTPSFDYSVDKNFDWSVHKVIDVAIKIADQYEDAGNYEIEIYKNIDTKIVPDDMTQEQMKSFVDGFNVSGHKQKMQYLDGAILSGDAQYSTRLTVLKTTETLTIVQIDPDGNKAQVDVDIIGNALIFDFKSYNTAPVGISVLGMSRTSDLTPGIMREGAETSEHIPNDDALNAATHAIGASKQLGAALKIKNINGISSASLTPSQTFSKIFTVINGKESDNNDVVVPLFENVHALFGRNILAEDKSNLFVNVGQTATIAPYEFLVELDLKANPVDASTIIADNFNLFIVIGEKDRNGKRTEIHHFGGQTTSKASNITDFANNSSTIWGVLFDGDFKHPTESTHIGVAYPQFKAWVEGNNNTEWYKFPVEGKVTNPL